MLELLWVSVVLPIRQCCSQPYWHSSAVNSPSASYKYKLIMAFRRSRCGSSNGLSHSMTTFAASVVPFKGGLPGRTQCKLAIEEGPLPSRRTVHPILQMTAMPSCAPTSTPYKIYGRSGSSVSVDASLLLALPVKNVVDTVPRGRSSDAAIGSECGTLWIG